MIAAIVAVDNNWGIGYNGELLEHIPEDLKYFKQLTTDKTVVMGRKTWESLPLKPLPNRLNIVISSQGNTILNKSTIRMDLDTVKEYLNSDNIDCFIIGGGVIYKELLSFCDRIYVTKIYKTHSSIDTYFPNLDQLSEWSPVNCSDIYDYKDLTYQFWQYDRVN